MRGISRDDLPRKYRRFTKGEECATEKGRAIHKEVEMYVNHGVMPVLPATLRYLSYLGTRGFTPLRAEVWVETPPRAREPRRTPIDLVCKYGDNTNYCIELKTSLKPHWMAMRDIDASLEPDKNPTKFYRCLGKTGTGEVRTYNNHNNHLHQLAKCMQMLAHCNGLAAGTYIHGSLILVSSEDIYEEEYSMIYTPLTGANELKPPRAIKAKPKKKPVKKPVPALKRKKQEEEEEQQQPAKKKKTACSDSAPLRTPRKTNASAPKKEGGGGTKQRKRAKAAQ